MNTGAQLILEEEIDEDYEPLEEELHEYAKSIGLDPKIDADLLWIAREGITAPLPPQWKPCQDSNGDIYFFNFKNGESLWDHPCDHFYSEMVITEKNKRQLKTKANKSHKAETVGPLGTTKEPKLKQLMTPLNQVKNNSLNPVDNKQKQIDSLPLPPLLKKLPLVSLDHVPKAHKTLDMHESSSLIDFSDDKALTRNDFLDDIAKDESSKHNIDDLISELEINSDLADMMSEEVLFKLPTKGFGGLSAIQEVSGHLEKSSKTEHLSDIFDEHPKSPTFDNITLNDDEVPNLLNEQKLSLENVIPATDKLLFLDTQAAQESLESDAENIEDALNSSNNNAKDSEKYTKPVEQPVSGITEASTDDVSKDKQGETYEPPSVTVGIESKPANAKSKEAEIFLEKIDGAAKITQQEIKAVAEKDFEKIVSQYQSEVQQKSKQLRAQFLQDEKRLEEIKCEQENYLMLLKQELDENFDKSLTEIMNKTKEYEKDLDSSLERKMSALMKIQERELEILQEKHNSHMSELVNLHNQEYNQLTEKNRRKSQELDEKLPNEPRISKEIKKEKVSPASNIIDSSGPAQVDISTNFTQKYDVAIENLKKQQRDFDFRYSSSRKKHQFPPNNKTNSFGAHVTDENESKSFATDPEIKDQLLLNRTKPASSIMPQLTQIAWAKDIECIEQAKAFLELHRQSVKRRNPQRSTYARPSSVKKEGVGNFFNRFIQNERSHGLTYKQKSSIYSEIYGNKKPTDYLDYSGMLSTTSTSPNLSTAHSSTLNNFEKISQELLGVSEKLNRILDVINDKRANLTSLDLAPATNTQIFSRTLGNVEYEFARQRWDEDAEWKRPFSMGNWRYTSGRQLMEEKANQTQNLAIYPGNKLNKSILAQLKLN